MKEARPVLFTIVAAPDRPVVTCFGISAADGRLKKGEWLQGAAGGFHGRWRRAWCSASGRRISCMREAGGTIELGQGTYPVAGVVRMENGFENGGVFMPLRHVPARVSQGGRLLGDDRGARRWARLGRGEGLDGRHHHERLAALENEEFSRTYSQFRIMKTTAWVVGGCAFLLGGLSVTNTMILSVFGRIKELAIARVCGFSREPGGGDDFRRVAVGFG